MRCFLAIELPEFVRMRITELQARLRELDRAVRWTKPEQIHLTLKFFGDVPDAEIATLCQTTKDLARTLSPFEIDIAGTGCFPPSGPPRVVWAGVGGPPPQLVECQRRCEEAYAPLGYPPEGRAYRPHLTIGRTRDGTRTGSVRIVLNTFEGFSAGKFSANELVFFQSILGRDRAAHVPLARAPLSRGSGST